MFPDHVVSLCLDGDRQPRESVWLTPAAIAAIIIWFAALAQSVDLQLLKL
jgi:hypothetical protein